MKSKKRTYYFFLYTNILLVLVTILSAMASIVDPRDSWIFSFLGLGFPVLALLNILFIILWFFKKLRYSLISIVCLLVFQKQIKTSIGFNIFSNSGIEQLDAFHVMSYNTSNFRHNVKNKEALINQRKSAIKFISSEVKPDILCTQELTNAIKDRLVKSFNNYNLHEVKDKVTLIITKFPIVNKGQIDFTTNTNSCVWADLKIRNDTIRVYSVHLQSNRISADASKLLSEETGYRDWSKLSRIFSRYKKYSVKRAQQSDMIRAHINHSPHPVIVCGDLNDTPQSYSYNTIKGDLDDAFLENGFGLGVSFGGKIPGLRIDYILPDKQFKTINFNCYKKEYSDHYPISSILKLQH